MGNYLRSIGGYLMGFVAGASIGGWLGYSAGVDHMSETAKDWERAARHSAAAAESLAKLVDVQAEALKDAYKAAGVLGPQKPETKPLEQITNP